MAPTRKTRLSARERDLEATNGGYSASPSPKSPATTRSSVRESGRGLRRSINATPLAPWEEPELPPPQPSFADHKGLERGGVLQGMHPLGSLPPEKTKPKSRAENARRVLNGVNGDVPYTKEDPDYSPHVVPILGSRRSESRKVIENKAASPAKKNGKSRASPDPITPTTSKARTAPVPNSAMTPRSKMKQAVDWAIERARTSKNKTDAIAGLALKKMLDDSASDPSLYLVMDAVITRRANKKQRKEFKRYVKKVKKTAIPPPRKITAENILSSNPTVEEIKLFFINRTGSGAKKRGEESAIQQSGSRKGSSRKTRAVSISSASSASSEASEPKAVETPSGSRKRHRRNQSTKSNPTIEPPKGPTLHLFHTSGESPPKSPKRKFDEAELEVDPAEEEMAAKKQKYKQDFTKIKILFSNVRKSGRNSSPLASTTPKAQEPSATASSTPVYSTRSRRDAASRRFQEVEESPVEVQEESVPPEPSFVESSRPVTPTDGEPPLKKQKRSARVKVSPQKRAIGVVAGIGRISGDRSSPIGGGPNQETGEDENDDFCSACGGSGELLCCDGCDRSFHFKCLDPPMDSDTPPEDDWFCAICTAKKNPPVKRPKSLFSGLFDNLDRKNPLSFRLPAHIRDYFEGVRTAEGGEYEDTAPTKARTRGGYEEEPDLLKLKDAKGQLILCFKCGKSSANGQKIIQCDYCTLNWHLDCLDPPLANPPPSAKKKSPWKCPNHADHELEGFVPESARGRRKIRRPKQPDIVDVYLRRGFRNDGLIEVQLDPEDYQDEFYRPNARVVYRLQERGIKLDFIDRVKRSREESMSIPTRYPSEGVLSSRGPDSAMLPPSGPAGPTTEEQQVALSLAEFAQSQPDVDIMPDAVDSLLRALIEEAPPDLAGLINGSSNNTIPPSPPPSDSRVDRESVDGLVNSKDALLALQKLIQRRLETID